MTYVLALGAPLRSGQTQHHYLVLEFKKDLNETVKINMKADEIQDRFEGKLEEEVSGHLFDVLSRLLKALAKTNIIVPAGFKSQDGAEAVKCSVKAHDGLLYPMQKSLLFIYKPVIFIRLDEIVSVDFARYKPGS